MFRDLVTKKTIGLGYEQDGLNILDSSLSVATSAIKRDASASGLDELFTWHRRLGHLSFFVLRKMFPNFSYSKYKFFCEPCQLPKYCRSIYPISNNNKSTIPFSLVHSDIWGPSSTNSLFEFCYFITFFVDCSRVTWVYLLKHKNDVYAAFQSFHNMVLTQFNAKVKILRSDNGGEYLSYEFTSFLDTSGIIH